MNKRRIPPSIPSLLAALAVAGSLSLQAQHNPCGHLNAGAFSTSQDAQLYFVNGANFVTNSGYVTSLNFTNSHGYYRLRRTTP